MSTVDDTIAERQATHGSFVEQAGIMQAVKDALKTGSSYASMKPEQREALDMIAHKLGRIVTGDPSHVDHWHDIAGYARLVERQLTAAMAITADPQVDFQSLAAGTITAAKVGFGRGE